MNRFFPALALGMSLSACQAPGGAGNPHHWVSPEGSALHLTRDLQVMPGWARITLQGGRPVHPNAVDSGQPSCELRVGQAATQAAPIAVTADRFAIDQVNRRYAATPYSRQVASLLFIEGEREDHRTFQTKLSLTSPRQPMVRYMTCEITGDPRWVRHLSVEQIREALGATFELRLGGA